MAMEMSDGACSVNRGQQCWSVLDTSRAKPMPALGFPLLGAPMRILVCGGRTYDDRASVWRTLDDYQRRYGPVTIIQGGATGADALAKEWCYRQPNVTLISVPANWEDPSPPDALICIRADGSKYDTNASIRRYAEMLDEKPDLVLAFPGNRGTRHILRRAEDAKKNGMPIKINKVGW